ncbi:MAG: helix-turn-helix domain-containing protein [Methylocystis sp.]
MARDGSAAHRFARRANALVLLDDGWSCERVAAALFLDDDTIRRWHALFLVTSLHTSEGRFIANCFAETG